MQTLSWFLCIFFCNFFVLAIAASNIKNHPSWKLLDHEKCGSSNSDRIIGGKNASLGAYPWIVRIGYSVPNSTTDKLSYNCGGSLINGLYVVTAAHCVTNLPNRFKVAGIRIGEHNTATDPDCEDGYCAEPVQDFKPASIIVHEKYNRPEYRNDIALIRLDKPVKYNDNASPVCMVEGDLLSKNFVGEIAEVAGWGIYDIHKPRLSTVLQTVSLPIVENKRCKLAFGLHVDIGEEQMCVGGNVGTDSCSGDSGGPLSKVESLDGPPKYYIVGIVSFGVKHCGESTAPAIYTRLSSYVSWILDNISP